MGQVSPIAIGEVAGTMIAALVVALMVGVAIRNRRRDIQALQAVDAELARWQAVEGARSSRPAAPNSSRPVASNSLRPAEATSGLPNSPPERQESQRQESLSGKTRLEPRFGTLGPEAAAAPEPKASHQSHLAAAAASARTLQSELETIKAEKSPIEKAIAAQAAAEESNRDLQRRLELADEAIVAKAAALAAAERSNEDLRQRLEAADEAISTKTAALTAAEASNEDLRQRLEAADAAINAKVAALAGAEQSNEDLRQYLAATAKRSSVIDQNSGPKAEEVAMDGPLAVRTEASENNKGIAADLQSKSENVHDMLAEVT